MFSIEGISDCEPLIILYLCVFFTLNETFTTPDLVFSSLVLAFCSAFQAVQSWPLQKMQKLFVAFLKC